MEVVRVQLVRGGCRRWTQHSKQLQMRLEVVKYLSDLILIMSTMRPRRVFAGT